MLSSFKVLRHQFGKGELCHTVVYSTPMPTLSMCELKEIPMTPNSLTSLEIRDCRRKLQQKTVVEKKVTWTLPLLATDSSG